MNALSLFNGMGCFEIAAIESDIEFETIYTSEIDKHALNQTRLNFPNDIELGNVRNIDVSKLKPIHFLAGGSPCQSFSFAGKRKGMSTKSNEDICTLDRYLQLKAEGFEFEGQSYLFWEYMRILTDIRKYNPNVLFLLENVEMGNKWERVLSEAIGIYGVHINSALVSAQNRKRIYWTNICTRQEGLFGELHSDIPQPTDRGILLRDILESEVDEKYYLSEKMTKWLDKHDQKSKKNGNGFKLNLKNGDEKGGCISSGAFKQNLSADYICVSMVGRKLDENGVRKDNDPNIKAIQRLEPNTDGKTNCLTSVQKDNLIMQLNPSNESGGKQPYQGNRIYDESGIHPALMSEQRVYILQRIRRLTPTECARLQTIPEWYKWACSDTQQYRMLGNGWTVEVIKHIFSFINIV